MDEYIQKIKKISDFAAGYGMGIGLSLLSPLDIGPGFVRKTGQSGRWLHYAVGVRDAKTGRFNVQLWRQLYWTNNKGKIPVKLKGVQAYAFKEKTLANGRFSAVNPGDIRKITSETEIETYDTTSIVPAWEPSSLASDVTLPIQRVNIRQDANNEWPGFDRVFVMLEYETPEMDYFSPEVPVFLNNMLGNYHKNGINLTSLYSDEMHIQQDWYYFDHHDNGQFALRYLTKNMADTYASNYGSEFSDMDKYMLYFVYGPKTIMTGPFAVNHTQYVMGETPEAISRTMLFRDRYYKLLNNRVVDVFIAAKKYGESLYKHELKNGAHASWAQSPTIDLWDTGNLKLEAYQYEYTSNFIWANTVQQASAACYDYFKWGDYLQPTGNDFAECGWLDRNYYGAAMATSIGVINKYPNAYAAYWGMPEAARRRKEAINNAFGARANKSISLMTGNVHRDVDVLILYPMNLVASEERFGSWMTQYAYANFITAEKLLELGKITADGHIKIAEKTYSTLVTLYEPLPVKGLLGFMKNFVSTGGRLVWFGPPALLNGQGENCSAEWSALLNVSYQYSVFQGEIASGKIVNFKNRFKNIPSQTILTDFLVDRIYPVVPLKDAEQLAEADGRIVGAGSKMGKGSTYYFGFRPRDDQSASLGYETRTLFEILNAAGAYQPTGKFAGINDHTEYVSRNSDYLTTRFPNGTTMIVRHYRTHRENWLDGFSRNAELDNLALKENPMPGDELNLSEFKVNGHNVSYHGRLTTAFRLNGKNELIAFDGSQCNQINIDGRNYVFAEKPFDKIAFAPENEELKSFAVSATGEGMLSLPLAGLQKGKFVLTDAKNKPIKYQSEKERVIINITPEISGKWLRLVQK
jgi:hypothetical protein